MFLPSLRLRWVSWCQIFAARSRRERMAIAAAVAALIVYSVYELWIRPGLEESKRLRTELLSQAQVLQSLKGLLATNVPDPDAANRERLSEVEQRLRERESALERMGARLLPPQEAPRFLQEVLRGSASVRLIAIKTLPPQRVVRDNKTGSEEASSGKAMAGQEREEVPNQEREEAPNLYRHGIEIKVSGNYLDLLRYLARLEEQKKFFWGDVRLAVERYPESILTVRLYTFSLEPTWLAL